MITLKDIEALAPYIIQYREHFHQNPETGFEEIKTTDTLRKELKTLGYTLHKTPLKTGVIATLNDHYNKTICLRADIDALKMTEENEVPYKSLKEGLMHACGHDAHMAMLLGAAKYFSAHQKNIKGRIKLIFQPAEEGPLPGGAYHLVKAGVLDDVDAVFGIHITTLYKTGQVHIKSGPAMAAPDVFELIIRGEGTHASAPESGQDVIVTAASIINHIQQIVSREISAKELGVISVSTIHGGTTFNVLPDEVTMTGTIRSFTEEIRSFLHKRLTDITMHIAQLNNTEATINIEKGYPALINDQAMTDFVANCVKTSLGDDHLIMDDEPSMGGEDFAYYLQQKPGAFYWLGGRHPNQKEIYYNHNPKFDIDPDSLLIGTLLHINTVLNYFN
jgi:amidohydrolase